MKTDILVVGSGLFGSMTAKFFRKQGYTVTIIDAESPFAASKCSFGVWKDSWVNNSIKKEVEMGLPYLDEVAEIEQVRFFNMNKEVEEVYNYVDCGKIMESKFIKGTVYDISEGGKRVKYVYGEGQKGSFEVKKATILCVGAFLPMLLVRTGLNLKKMVHVDMYWGATLRIKGLKVEENRIKDWAPYKQSVLLNKGGRDFVFGDGSTVKNPRTSDERVSKASDRLIHNLNDVLGSSVDVDKITEVNEGYRPYLKKGSPDFISQHDTHVWSATGGAKNSTILCSYIAQELYRRLHA